MGTTKEYLCELYRQSAKQTQHNLETKGAFVMLAFKMGFAAIGIALLVLLGLLPNDNPIYKTVLVIFTSDIIGFIAMWFISPIVSIWNMPKIAALNNKQQKERLEEVDPKLTKIIVSVEPIGELGGFLRKKVGIDIKNKRNEDFSGVLELKEIIMLLINDQCEEFPSNHGVDISSSRFPNLNINGKDHIVIDFAEIRDSIGNDKGSGLVILTEKIVPLLLTEMLFIRPDGVPEPNFAKARFLIQIEIRGKFSDNTFYRKIYDTSIMLRANVLSNDIGNDGRVIFGSRKIESNIEIEGVEVEGVWNDEIQEGKT